MPLPIFGKSSKNPADVVRILKEALQILETKSTNTSGEAAGMFWPAKFECNIILASIIYIISDNYIAVKLF